MMKARKPTICDCGIVAFHDQACAVHHDESAVYQCNNGVFYPSWKAQAEGWRLVRATSLFQRWLLRLFFNRRPHA